MMPYRDKQIAIIALVVALIAGDIPKYFVHGWTFQDEMVGFLTAYCVKQWRNFPRQLVP